MYMYIGVCVYVCIYVCTCTYVPRYVCMLAVCVAASATVCLVCLTFLYGHHHKCCLRISAYNVCIYVVCMYRQISIHIYIYIRTHVYVYIYIIVYIYAVTYMHTYIHTYNAYIHTCKKHPVVWQIVQAWFCARFGAGTCQQLLWRT